MHWEANRVEAVIRRMLQRERFAVSGELRALVISALWDFLERQRLSQPSDFTVDEWKASGGARFRIIAETCDLTVAHAAFEAATQKWPEAVLTLRKGAWTIRQWPERER